MQRVSTYVQDTGAGAPIIGASQLVSGPCRRASAAARLPTQLDRPLIPSDALGQTLLLPQGIW